MEIVKFNKPKAIIFDCFNTLVSNSIEEWKNAFKLICSNFGLSITPEEFWKTWKNHELLFRSTRLHTNNDSENQFITQKPFKSYSEAWKECLIISASELNLKINIEDCLQILLNSHSRRKIFEETKFVLNELKKEYKIFIISNADDRFLYPCIQPLDIPTSNIFSSESLKLYKPDKKIFQNVLLKLKINPEEAWYVGDNYFDDVIGSYLAGLNPIWINRNNVSKNNNYKINKLIEIRNLTELIVTLNNI
ncbi:MAG: hypothetical protein CL764_04665 [Chloroflexi bacterium]|nr:hypothetical protein [Chloroflexota bacterium]|tara:strand:- start:2512 stop:3258 length:747 start_codon:yes stop_codon:yes gene_type:complete